MAFEVYKNAPITEAVLDIRTRLEKPSLERLAGIRDARYPNLFQTPNLMAFTFAVNEGQPSLDTSSQALGFSYRSDEEKDIFQVRRDGFTHNRLPPYTEWGSFSAEARRLWLVYKEGALPAEVEWISLNYINEIYVPFATSFENYFRTYVEVPKELPQMLLGFSFTYQVVLPADAGLLQIAQGYGPFRKPEHTTVILNIQASKQVNKKTSDISEDELWDMFEKLRFAKSQAFEACITEKVRMEIR